MKDERLSPSVETTANPRIAALACSSVCSPLPRARHFGMAAKSWTMGCVQAKEASAPPTPASLDLRRSRRPEKERPAATAPLASGRKSRASLLRVDTSAEAPDAVARKEEEQVERSAGGRQPRRRRSRPDPRLSNPQGHLRGEQVAAGWPSWLAQAAGEALQGWMPRRADSFEKIDKARTRFLCELRSPFLLSFFHFFSY